MAKKPDLWMPWYLGDYLTDTTHLSRAEHGSYLLMLAHAWMHNGILPSEDERLARIAHATPTEWQECRNVIMEFWTPVDGGYVQKRLLEEMSKAKRMVEQRSEAGKASAAKRWGNESITSVTNSLPVSYERNHAPSPSPSPIQSQAPSKPQPSRSKADATATRLPTDWLLPESWERWAIQKRGWSTEEARNVSESFRDWWIAKPGKDGRKLDWFATWRTWVRNQRSGNGKGSVASENKAAVAEFLAKTTEKEITGERIENDRIS